MNTCAATGVTGSAAGCGAEEPGLGKAGAAIIGINGTAGGADAAAGGAAVVCTAFALALALELALASAAAGRTAGPEGVRPSVILK
ncbi:hypothetical protein [Limnohabitans sp.]|uniref:hypothetical protein n=1 Tax=Limnohabitans sp. TaxID=1907725 RepID=UPI0037C06543